MIHALARLLGAAACLALMSTTASAQQAPPAWPHAADIPTPAPVAVGLAGASEPDLVRFFAARGPLYGASISPDGRTAAYRSDVTGAPQLWVVDVDGGMPRQLTFGAGVSAFAWSPNNELLVAADSNGDEREGYTIISRDGLHERQVRERGAAFVSFGAFSPDGARYAYATTERNGDDFDIFVGAADGSGAREAYRGRFGNFVASWRPNSPEVIVTETRGEDAVDVHILNVDTGRRRTLFRPRVAASYTGFQWAPDGSGFYMATDDNRELHALAYHDLARGRTTVLEGPAGDVEQVTLFGGGRYLAWAVNDGGYSRLNVRDLSTNQNLRVPAMPNGVYELAGSDDAARLLVRIDGPQTPGELWLVDASANTARLVVGPEPAGLDLSTMVVPQSVSFMARDGVGLQGLLYMPTLAPGAAPPPIVVLVHGGPTGQARPSFDAITQYLVARGIAAFDLNFRGSTGFGKTFARLDNGRNRPNAVRDIEDTMNFLRSDGRVDVSRAAVMGGSYGGYLTNAVLGEYPDLFRAGVSFVGVSDWVHALEGASPALKASDRIEYGNINDPADRAFFAELSPIRRANQIRADLFVVHGANDPRDPVTESDRLVSIVRENGGEVTYMRFADEGHGIRRLANRVHAYNGIADFLEQSLIETPTTAPSSE